MRQADAARRREVHDQARPAHRLERHVRGPLAAHDAHGQRGGLASGVVVVARHASRRRRRAPGWSGTRRSAGARARRPAARSGTPTPSGCRGSGRSHPGAAPQAPGWRRPPPRSCSPARFDELEPRLAARGLQQVAVEHRVHFRRHEQRAEHFTAGRTRRISREHLVVGRQHVDAGDVGQVIGVARAGARGDRGSTT